MHAEPDNAIHGVLVEINGCGVLLEGEAGVGKSETALSLLSRGHRLIADDVVLVEKRGGKVRGRAPENLSGLLALRDLGLIDVTVIFGKGSTKRTSRIDLVIELVNGACLGEVTIELPDLYTSVLGVDLKKVRLRAGPGRDLATLVEAAALWIKKGPPRDRSPLRRESTFDDQLKS
jgi:HPr kinase/phosphorylase